MWEERRTGAKGRTQFPSLSDYEKGAGRGESIMRLGLRVKTAHLNLPSVCEATFNPQAKKMLHPYKPK